ncbi:MAG: LysR family transcriptional regulator [Polyangiaceae bacterium]|nr:LysR family transcriptional regulator [Myxococcales bacterium]MCB9586171.1 LysR family transcriptional regulator [Polyangiaceae bacterium]MCB9606848.1 LysR family transcriptional regulator [Polyangiaceae bacterium]
MAGAAIIHEVDIATLDLNLLVALEALLLEGHVTRAARRVHVSQPAMSRALARLREMLGDELLVRVGQQMQPTPKAEALLPRLQRILAEIRGLIAPDGFDPKQARGVLRLAAPDIVTFMLGPALMRTLRRDAPGLDLEIVRWSPAWREQLASGEVDLTIGEPRGDERGIYAKPLVRQRWATVLRRGHPALRKRWSLDTFVQLDHLLIGVGSEGSAHVDVALARLGKSRRVGLKIPYVVLSPLIVAETDLVLTTALWLAKKLYGQARLVIKQPPRQLELAPVDLPMVWHERAQRDPQQRWLRDVLSRLAEEAGMLRPA